MGFIQEQAITGVPPWLPELLHYEWMELVVEAHPGRILPSGRPVTETSTLAINPTLQNLQYQWPVHTIAPQSLPDRPTVCCLLVYRRSDHRVTFVEVTPLAAALLQIIAQQPCTLAVLTSTLRDLWPAGQAPVPQSQIREAVAGFVANEIVVEEASLASPS